MVLLKMSTIKFQLYHSVGYMIKSDCEKISTIHEIEKLIVF